MTVSVVGLGQMGTTLASTFLAKGYPTTVWNRSPNRAEPLMAQGAAHAPSLNDAVSASDLVVICVSDYAAVSELLQPVAEALAGRVLVNLSSGTPQQAREMARWVAQHGAAYLDGAAMSGTRLVGSPEALFLFSGSPDAFAAHQQTLRAWGNAVHLGDDPGLGSLYDTALFGMVWGALASYYHAVALVGTEGVRPHDFASVVVEHLPFVAHLMRDHARQIDDGHFPDDDGTLDAHAAAMGHLVTTSRDHGVDDDVPRFLQNLLDRGVAADYGTHGIASIIGTIRRAGQHGEQLLEGG